MKNKESYNWVWYCKHDTWSWEDGFRCRARSRKPTTEGNAIKGLNNHINTVRTGGYHHGGVVQLTKSQLKKFFKK